MHTGGTTEKMGGRNDGSEKRLLLPGKRKRGMKRGRVQEDPDDDDGIESVAQMKAVSIAEPAEATIEPMSASSSPETLSPLSRAEKALAKIAGHFEYIKTHVEGLDVEDDDFEGKMLGVPLIHSGIDFRGMSDQEKSSIIFEIEGLNKKLSAILTEKTRQRRELKGDPEDSDKPEEEVETKLSDAQIEVFVRWNEKFREELKGLYEGFTPEEERIMMSVDVPRFLKDELIKAGLASSEEQAQKIIDQVIAKSAVA